MSKSKSAYYSSIPYTHKLSKKQRRREEAIAALPVAGLDPKVYAAVFAAAIFVSAGLLFLIEPMVAKMMLPLLGGVPAVWTTCMVFFQIVLLGGYLYAHQLTTRCTPRTQVITHMCLLAFSIFFLPIGIAKLSLIASSMSRIVVVLALLTFSVGVPFFVLSASAPLLQSWFSRTGHVAARDPYFLYIGSNVGSLLALLTYPVVIEPVIGLHLQSQLWCIGYAALIALFAGSAYLLMRAEKTANAEGAVQEKIRRERPEDVIPPSITQRAVWVGLAFVPSSLMLGVTTFFTTDVATIPLLWIMPLTLYLLSFILVFSKTPPWVHRWSVRLLPLAVMGLLCLSYSHAFFSIVSQLMIHLGVFFLVSVAFHGEMARTRPVPKYLTQFYLLMSVGGVLGGLFNGILAPLVFRTAAEYPLALVAACMLLPGTLGKRRPAEYPVFAIALDFFLPAVVGGITAWLNFKWPLLGPSLVQWAQAMGTDPYSLHQMFNYLVPAVLCLGLFFFQRSLRFGLAVGAFVVAMQYATLYNQDVIHQERSFFGILKVSNDYDDQFRTLTNGTTLHGRQALDPFLRREPLTYYHRLGPVGQVFEEFNTGGRPASYAAVGLGTGTLTAYAKAGQQVTVYEIDAAVQEIARKYFKYLEDAEAPVNIVMGDARLKLAEAPEHSYGLILVDAFSSDAIPVHLLTREAIQMYFQKVSKRGLVAIHTSNRYLSLEPVLANLASDLKLTVRVNHDNGETAVGKLASTWVILANDEESLGKLGKNPAWIKMEPRSWVPTWTDDFTSVLSILR